MPAAAVVESVQYGVVVAGPASELETGTNIRDAGDLYDGYTDPEVEAAHEQTHRADG